MVPSTTMMKTEAHSTVRISQGDRRAVEGLFIADPFNAVDFTETLS